MVVEFKVDIKRKRTIEKRLGHTAGAKPLKALRWLFCALMLAALLAFCFYAFFISREFVYQHNRYGTMGQKHTLFIWTVTGTIFVVMLILFLTFYILERGAANRNTSYRIAESLFWENGILRYSYKNFMHATPCDMVVVKFRMDDGMNIYYNKDTQEICFHGLISSIYYEDYRDGVTDGCEEYITGDYSIYDYFAPTLRGYLEQKGFL